jgi:prepilin-type processing-associated H-X9-DG protein
MITHPAETIAVADTQGVRRDDGSIGAGEYTIDPPLTSLRGSGKTSGYYGEGSECGSGAQGCRSTPAEWATQRVTIAWCDGHATTMRRSRMDDKDGDGQQDNGFWNGRADAAVR